MHLKCKLLQNSPSLGKTPENNTHLQRNTTLSLAQYPKNMVQTMVTYLYTGIMENPHDTQCELFRQLLSEYGLMSHYDTALQEYRLMSHHVSSLHNAALAQPPG